MNLFQSCRWPESCSSRVRRRRAARPLRVVTSKKGASMSTQTLVLVWVAGAFAFAVLVMLGTAFFTVDQRTAAIVQRLGRFVREAGPGLHVKVPFIDRVIGRINLRVQQLDVRIETKTEDNVFAQMVVAAQYYVRRA